MQKFFFDACTSSPFKFGPVSQSKYFLNGLKFMKLLYRKGAALYSAFHVSDFLLFDVDLNSV